MKHVLDVKATTNTAMVYAETGRYPLAIHVNLFINKFWFKILNSDVHQLIYIIYHYVFQQSYLGEWLSHVKNILCINDFGKVWIDKGVTNQNRFLKALEMLNVHILSTYLLNIKMILKKNWKILNETLSRNTKKQIRQEFSINNQLVSDPEVIANSFNEYFVSMDVN